MKRGYVDVPEGQVHYREEGLGEVIILLHMASSSGNEFSRIIPYLSGKYRAIAIDLLGFGESDKPPRKYSIEDHTRTVFQVMDALKIEKATPVGGHAGAKIGLEMAVTNPDRVEKLIMFGLSFLSTEKDFKDYEIWRSDPAFQPVELHPDGSHLMEWWRRSARYGDSMEVADEKALDFHKAGPRGEELHEAAFSYTFRVNVKLPLVKAPTLLIAAEKDRHAKEQIEAQKLLRRSRVVHIKNAGVFMARAMPKEYAETILNFMEKPGV